MKLTIIKEVDDTDSVFIYIDNFIPLSETIKLKNKLANVDFIPNYNYSGTKIIRYQKWYQNDNKYFCDKWKSKFKRWEANNYFKELTEFQNVIIEKVKDIGIEKLGISIPEFNSCLINKYFNDHYIRAHRDTDQAFGKEPVILGISLGSATEIVFKRVKYNGVNKSLSKRDKQSKYLDFKWKLKPNSLFIMAGSSQKYWTHQIPKSHRNEPRISLTFRRQL